VNLLRACDGWPRAAIPDDFKQPVRSTVPMLLISGEADPVTPPRHAAETARTLPNARHLVLPGMAHSELSPGCVAELIRRFVDSADARALDAACVGELKRPPFELREGGGAPVKRAL
jgi:pimeloyl-ACP methyl ester carboxylesterase